jgi:hypothetical protein
MGRSVMVSFVCGDDPRHRSFHPDLEHAKRFPTADAALDYRNRMPRQLGGGAAQYDVYQVLADGGLVALGL